MSWTNPIFDRTQTDLNYLKSLVLKLQNTGYESLSESEKTYWLNNIVKASLNTSDLNRIEDNIKYISDDLNSKSISNIIVNRSSSWNMNDILFKQDMDRILNNLNVILNAINQYNPSIIYELTCFYIRWVDFIPTSTWYDLKLSQSWYNCEFNQTQDMIFSDFKLNIDSVNVLEELLNIMKNELI